MTTAGSKQIKGAIKITVLCNRDDKMAVLLDLVSMGYRIEQAEPYKKTDPQGLLAPEYMVRVKATKWRYVV